jgi:hypothetical protein
MERANLYLSVCMVIFRPQARCLHQVHVRHVRLVQVKLHGRQTTNKRSIESVKTESDSLVDRLSLSRFGDPGFDSDPGRS